MNNLENIVTRSTVTAILLAFGATSWAAPTRDHLQCLKIKDSAVKAQYTADLTTGSLVLPTLEPGCTINVPAKLLCIDVAKGNVVPSPPGSPPGADAQAYLCYKAKCTKLETTMNATDQFGAHALTLKTTSLVCAPIVSPSNCGAGETNCSGTCADLDTDEANCGGCGTICNMGEVCTGGTCALACAPGETDCSGICVDLDTDVDNCGACNTACPDLPNATEACTAGTCTIGACDAGFGDCDSNPLNGCEADTQNDPNHCGACFSVCPVLMPACVSGACF